MSRSANVLIVDDDPALRQTMEAIVKSAGMNSITAGTGEEALETIRRSPVDVMLLDVQLPGVSGLHVLRQVRERHPDIGVIMVSVVKEIPVAVEAIKYGALDYVTKDFSPGELSARVSKSLEQLRSERELAWLRDEVASRGQKPMVLGRSAAMATVWRSPTRWRPSRSRSSSPERAAPARRWWRASSTSILPARTAPS
jgi:DNA-binding NtrC family response regulator